MNAVIATRTGRVGALGVWVVVCFGAAGIGAGFGPGEWYAGLNKPSWNPPNWIFGPVWTVLYVMMAVSAWRVTCRGPFPGAWAPLGLFLVQLGLNALWTPVFFGWHAMGAAFGVIVVLWFLIASTAWAFGRVDRLAGALLVPYLGWVGFASFLNWTLWRMN